jgi:hypothetical protein
MVFHMRQLQALRAVCDPFNSFMYDFRLQIYCIQMNNPVPIVLLTTAPPETHLHNLHPVPSLYQDLKIRVIWTDSWFQLSPVTQTGQTSCFALLLISLELARLGN